MSETWRQKAVKAYPPESGAPQPRSGERMGQWYLRLKRWEEAESIRKLSEAIKDKT